jgi:glycerophosphoryl diester phosphodiesterase
LKATSRPLLLGHRGVRSVRRFGARDSRRQIPAENTLSAFEYALSSGCDGIEFDVQLSADQCAVLCHDGQLDGKEIAATDYSDLLRGHKDLASLEEVLACFGDRAYLDIELKVGGDEEQVIAALRKKPPSRGYIVSSFLPHVLLRMNQLDASIPLGYICDTRPHFKIWTALPVAVLIPQCKLVSQETIDVAHGRGVKLFTWTVNQRRNLLRLADWGVDGLISDDPALLSHTFALRPLSG